jgi:hypothetical protein
MEKSSITTGNALITAEDASLQSAFFVGRVFNSRKEFIIAVQSEHWNIGKECCVYRNQKGFVKMLCVHQFRLVTKTEKMNARVKKEYVSAGGNPKLFQKQVPETVCCGFIQANPLKKNKLSLHNDSIRITALSPHTCVDPPASVSGGRTVPHSYKHLGSLASNITEKNPMANSHWVGNHVEEKLNMPSNTFSYQQKYRIKGATEKARWGDHPHQYGSIVHMLELMKEFDPDSEIYLKVFADSVDPNFFMNKARYRQNLREKSPSSPKKVFALRFGSMGVTMGSAARRHRAEANDALVVRKVRSIDATFLKSTSRGTSCDIIQFMSDGEITLETFTADAENESQNVWSFAFEIDRKTLGSRETSPQTVFIGDRLKGQDPTVTHWFPSIGKEDCVYHLKENMKEPKNGSANLDEMKLFDKIVHAAVPAEVEEFKDEFLSKVRDRVGIYASTSIFEGNSHLNRFSDGIIMEMGVQHEREREGIRSAQGSECFHSANQSERSFPLPIYFSTVYGKQYRTLRDLLERYTQYKKNGMRLPPKVQEQIDANTGSSANYSIFLCGPRRAEVTRIYGGVDPYMHEINLLSSPLCSRKCLERNGSLCSQAIMFIRHCQLDPINFIPSKYTVDGGINFLRISLGNIESSLSIEYTSLKMSSPPVIPPHSRIPKGRPRKKRLTKGHKRKKFLCERSKAVAEIEIANDDPEVLIHNPDSIPEAHMNHVQRHFTCRLCGGPHYSSSCRMSHDGMGNAILTATQNACLVKGFLILKIGKVGETVLPQDMNEFEEMRELSNMSTQSFGFDAGDGNRNSSDSEGDLFERLHHNNGRFTTSKRPTQENSSLQPKRLDAKDTRNTTNSLISSYDDDSINCVPLPLEDPSLEPEWLDVGDTITYWDQIAVAGREGYLKETVILATHPNERIILNLRNNDCLGRDYFIKKKGGGSQRRICEFKLKELGTNTGFLHERQRVEDILKDGLENLKQMTKDGICPIAIQRDSNRSSLDCESRVPVNTPDARNHTKFSSSTKIKNNDDQNDSDNETATFVADLDSDHSITKHHSDSEQEVFTVQDSIIGCSRGDVFSIVEAFTFLPSCSKCDHYNGYKIGNPYAQTDLKGKTYYKAYQNPRKWFDAATIVSFQLTCLHTIHPSKVSMFAHMGLPELHPCGYAEYDDDDIELMLYDQASGSEKPSVTPKQIDMNEGYKRHIGVVYTGAGSHFGVLEFLLDLRIIVIYDGLRMLWRKAIKSILNCDLPRFGDKIMRYRYLERDTRGISPSSSKLDEIRTWKRVNENLPSPNTWLVINSIDFNKVKFEYSQVSGNGTQHDVSHDREIRNMFTGLSYRPELIQQDGGYVCGPLACITFQDLIQMDDECGEQLCSTYESRSIHSIQNLRGTGYEMSQALRKSVLDTHMIRLYNMYDNNELQHKTRVVNSLN